MSNDAVTFTSRTPGTIHLSGLRDYLRSAGLPVLTDLAAATPTAAGKIHTACAMWCAQRVAWSHGRSIA